MTEPKINTSTQITVSYHSIPVIYITILSFLGRCNNGTDFNKWGLGQRPKWGRRGDSPRILPLSGERGQGDRDSKLEVCFKNRLFLQTESCDEMYVSPQLFLLLFCYRIARFDTDIPQLPTAEHALVTFYKNFSSFSVHKNKKILKNTGKVESNLL